MGNSNASKGPGVFDRVFLLCLEPAALRARASSGAEKTAIDLSVSSRAFGEFLADTGPFFLPLSYAASRAA